MIHAGADMIELLRRRRRARRLFRDIASGRWRRVLLDLESTQHRYPEVMRYPEKLDNMLVKVNLVILAVRWHATTLAAKAIKCSVPEGNEQQAAAITQIRSECLFDARLVEAVRRINVEGEAAVMVEQTERGACLRLVDNERYFPTGPAGHDGQPTAWEGRWIIEHAPAHRGDKPRRYLRVERHTAGLIEQEAYKTDSDDVLVDLAELERVPLASAIADGAAVPPERTLTGMRYPLLVQLVADSEDGLPVQLLQEQDLDLLDAFTASITRLVRVMEGHADPMMRIMHEMVDSKTGKFISGSRAVIDPDKQVEYIESKMQLERMLDMGDRVVGWMCMQLQISPALLGVRIGGGATPDSYQKLRLESSSTLARAMGTESYVRPALERLFTLATEIDARIPGRGGYAVAPVTVRMFPQIPKDRVELTSEIRELIRMDPVPLTSHIRALREIHGDEEADEVWAEIQLDLADGAKRQQAALFGAVPAMGAGVPGAVDDSGVSGNAAGDGGAA